jgi:hypothetical protein
MSAGLFDLDTGGCARCGAPPGECYCAEPSSGDPAYTGICPGCGGYEECYCGEE